jgi:hypothetical protein
LAGEADALRDAEPRRLRLQLAQVCCLARALPAAYEPADPARHVLQKPERVEVRAVSLPRLHAARLDDDGRALRRVEFGTDGRAL